VKLIEYIQAIEKAVGQEAILELLPLQAGDVPDTFADSSALEKVGYKPSVSVEDGVKQFVDWYRDFYQV
jgi:UDP-glucuronate 4-epimerase